MATPEQIRRRGRWPLILGTFVAAGLLAAVSWADTIAPDADVVAVGDQASRNLGSVAPGATLTPQVSFELQCAGNQHVDNAGSVSLTFSAAQSTIPVGGSMSATTASVGPIPASWPDDGNTCPSPAPTPIADNGNSTVTITAPTPAGTYTFVPKWLAAAPEAPDVTGTGPSVSFTLTVAAPDTSAPTISCTVPNQAIWYGTDATVNCTASDSGSGLANSGDASFSLSTSVASGTETATAATNSRQVCDNAGNCATAGPYTFKVDRRAPQLSSCDAPDGAWHATNVTLQCHYTDEGSGPATQDVDLMTDVAAGSEDANASASANAAQACDAVANCADSPADIPGNMVDRKGPTISCGSPDGLWHASNVSIACTASDGGSGLANSADTGFNLTTSVPAGTEDGNASTNSHAVADAVGNSATAGPINGNMVDRKAPSIACASPDGLWHASNVSIACTASDGGSGLANSADTGFNLTTSVPAGTEDGNASTNSHAVADAVGNSATAGPINGNMVDRKGPQLSSCDAPDGAWHATNVTLQCHYTDEGSGPATQDVDLMTDVAAGSEDANASASANGAQACDAVSNCADSPADITGNKVDRKAPQLSSCDAPDGAWHGDNVTLNCTYTDEGSGPASQQVALTTSVPAGSEDANASASANGAQACDAVSNCADSPADITGNKVDRKAPQLSSCDAPDGAWHGDNVTLNCTYTDEGSGPASQQVALTTSVPAGSEDANASASANAAQACDAVANCADSPADIPGNMVDRKGPTISCGSPDGLWHASNVSIACTASDGGSGLANSADTGFNLTTSVPAGTEDGNASTNSHAVADAVGNSATAGPINGNMVDRKGPQLSSCDAPDGAWHATNVTLQCHYTDEGSGPATQDVDLMTDVAAGSEDANASASANGAQACDAVSNCADSPADITGNKVDRKAPQLSSCDAPDGAWHGDNVTLNCTYTDEGSGPASQQVALTTSVPAGSEDANASASANGAQACDAVSNCADSPADITGNKVDRKAPQLSSCDAPDGAWHGDNVTLNCTYTDEGSGPASQQVALTTSVPAGSEDANASASANAAQACDAVANCADSPADIPGNMVDRKGPTISCAAPAPTFLLNQSPANVTGAATDGGSGPASQSLSATADTSSVAGNPKSVVLNATDNVGNSSTKSCPYSVVFDFHGFFQPVDNNSVFNVVKAGQAIPVKFDLSGYRGLGIFASGYPKQTPVVCSGSSGDDLLEETVTAGNSSLSYDGTVNAPIGQYIYVWKTDKAWAMTCRRLDVRLIDGTTHSALFKFSR